MRKLLCMIFIPFILALSFFCLVGFIKPEITINLNGKPVPFHGPKPVMYEDGRNYGVIAPGERLADAMGAKASIDFENRTMVVRKSAETITFFADKNMAVVNGREKNAPVSATIKDGIFYIPVGFLGENLGKTVFWASSSSSVNLFDSLNNNFILDKDAKSYVSISNFIVRPGKLLFYDNTDDMHMGMGYSLQERLNPNLNRQVYNMARTLVDKSYYTYVDYYVQSKKNPGIWPTPYIEVNLAKSADLVQEHPIFSFIFFEKTPVNPRKIWKHKGFSQNAVIKLELNNLYEAEKPENGWIDPFYENRLKLAFVSLYSDITGLAVCDFILEEYNNIKNDSEGKYNNYKKTRRFDDVRVDLAYAVYPNSKETMHVYFSYYK